MSSSRAEQRLTWEAVAAKGQISVATLRRVRNQLNSELTEDTKLAIEDGLRWLRGDVDRVLDGGTYTYRDDVATYRDDVAPPKQRRRPPLDPLTSSVEEILEFLQELRAERGAVYEKLRQATLDVNWLATQPNRPSITTQANEESEAPKPTN
jgi:hypothetical protein